MFGTELFPSGADWIEWHTPNDCRLVYGIGKDLVILDDDPLDS